MPCRSSCAAVGALVEGATDNGGDARATCPRTACAPFTAMPCATRLPAMRGYAQGEKFPGVSDAHFYGLLGPWPNLSRRTRPWGSACDVQSPCRRAVARPAAPARQETGEPSIRPDGRKGLVTSKANRTRTTPIEKSNYSGYAYCSSRFVPGSIALVHILWSMVPKPMQAQTRVAFQRKPAEGGYARWKKDATDIRERTYASAGAWPRRDHLLRLRRNLSNLVSRHRKRWPPVLLSNSSIQRTSGKSSYMGTLEIAGTTEETRRRPTSM
jgi:hypothetical protein